MGYYQYAGLYVKGSSAKDQSAYRELLSALDSNILTQKGEERDWSHFKNTANKITENFSTPPESEMLSKALVDIRETYFPNSFGPDEGTSLFGHAACDYGPGDEDCDGYVGHFTNFKSLPVEEFGQVIEALAAFDSGADIRAYVMGEEGEAALYRNIEGVVAMRQAVKNAGQSDRQGV